MKPLLIVTISARAVFCIPKVLFYISRSRFTLVQNVFNKMTPNHDLVLSLSNFCQTNTKRCINDGTNLDTNLDKNHFSCCIESEMEIARFGTAEGFSHARKDLASKNAPDQPRRVRVSAVFQHAPQRPTIPFSTWHLRKTIQLVTPARTT